MVKRISLAALAALTLAPLVAAPVRAQVGPDADVYVFGRPGPDRYEYDRPRRRPPPPPPPGDEDDRPRYDRRWRSVGLCLTAGVDGWSRSGPYDTSCGCEIPGFGYKRGRIGG
ncbi:hypothetical protein [Methylobacterium sp. WL7]|uniref:hypothetical protein n=1 Tax=Methylobacterium sp. WL7 TaxID=2603900 RepID=UPI001FEF0A72|nr:hypothetical protein [Methylobacterium sp. WL7]